MHSELLAKVDLLIDMSGSQGNSDLLKEELKEIDKRINTIKLEIETISSFGDEKYINNSERLLDESVKNNLELQIKKRRASLTDLKKNIDELVNKKDLLSIKADALQKELVNLEQFIEMLKEKLNVSQEGTEVYNSYKESINDNNITFLEKKAKLEVVEASLGQISNELEYLYLADQEMNEKLESSEEKLKGVIQVLSSNKAYIDEMLKKADILHLEELNQEFTTLEKRKIEIITDPGIIGADAKALIIEDDLISAILKIKELVTIIKSKPYMDIESSANLEAILSEAHTKAIHDRDEFAGILENKSYESYNNIVVENRLSHLNTILIKINEKKNSILNDIETLDTIDIRIVQDELATARAIEQKLENDIIEYEKIIEEDENRTPKKKAILNTALNAKREEYKIISEVTASYELELSNLIKSSISMMNDDLEGIVEQIDFINNEIRKLQTILSNQNKNKDVLAIERDKEELKKLSENVTLIEHRLKFDKTPNEILDEIEIMLGSIVNLSLQETSVPEIEFELNEEASEEYKPLLQEIEKALQVEESSISLNDLFEIQKTYRIESEPETVEFDETPLLEIEDINEEPVEEEIRQLEDDFVESIDLQLEEAIELDDDLSQFELEDKAINPNELPNEINIPKRLKIINVESLVMPEEEASDIEYIDFDMLSEGDLL